MLVKFCEPQFNPLKGCETLRLGILEYYRNMDPSFSTADKDEGKDTYSINYIRGNGNLAELRAEKFLKISGVIDDNSNISTITRTRVTRTFPNSYIWCCKYFEKRPTTQDGLSLDRKYKSSYAVKDAFTFVKQLGGALYSSIKLEMFTERAQEHILRNSIKLSDIKLICTHGPVRYVDLKHGVYGEHETTLYDETLNEFFRPAFVKTLKYRSDNEYRFLYLFKCPQTEKELSVRSEPSDISASTLIDLLKSSRNR